MDQQSEALFISMMANNIKNKTLILVTHKVAMLSLVDKLVVIDDGKIVTYGPKQKVLEALKAGEIKVKNA